jgi:hypothetical protein
LLFPLLLADTVEKTILRGSPSNIDSRRPLNPQDRIKNPSLAIRLLRAGVTAPTFSTASTQSTHRGRRVPRLLTEGTAAITCR